MDEKEYLREKKKSALRQSMINMTVGRKDVGEEDYEKDLRTYQRRKRLRLLLIVLAAALMIFLVWNYLKNKTYTSYKTIDEFAVAEGSASDYVTYLDGVIKYSKDGMSYINKSGKVIWNQAYDMKDPVVTVQGDYVAAADRMGYAVCICNSQGGTGMIQTNLPLTRISVSEKGVVAAILEDSASSYIALYDKDGTKLEIEIKALLEQSGYPMDIALSPSGQILAVAYVYLNQGTMLNQVVFYNFNEEGKEYVDRVVGGFKEYKETMIGQVTFLSEQTAVVFADQQVDFYSLKKSDEPALVKSCQVTGEIQSVFAGHNRAGVLAASADGSMAEILTVYDSAGGEAFTKEVTFAAKEAEFSAKGVLVYNTGRCMILNSSGRVRYQGELDGSIVKLVQVSDGDYMQIGETTIKRISLR